MLGTTSDEDASHGSATQKVGFRKSIGDGLPMIATCFTVLFVEPETIVVVVSVNIDTRAEYIRGNIFYDVRPSWGTFTQRWDLNPLRGESRSKQRWGCQ
jgi:hypothetical protein